MFTKYCFLFKFFTVTGNHNTMYTKYKIGSREFNSKVPIVIFLINSIKSKTYPEIGNSSFRCALWTFKQQLTLKVWAHCGISIVLL